ncbi:hypothetical protein DEI81_08870 [Curtobacterium sp. MCBD17_013]|uniref:hypothetical protein n=1 Tax=unclassified Curtobacterium TaxID=257496 RepID=UPI000DA9D150|nr:MULTISPECIES: hypothetical protein [unclassified Curtobacterium]PZE77747.1 hypothetical protein DEI82_02770 [Curtobacterium sp. MCBD17_019]PZF63043.1 hypothetical protein DEI81_08870 [Curtobacterium sp. MCBD17_013]WIB67517.1 hypothetical protein DEI93_00325 [Curtobacterium sp. MCBD17_035]
MSDTHDNGPDFAALDRRVAATRAQLFDTLDAIEDWFDVPKQLGVAVHRTRQGFEDHPVPYLAAFAGGVLVVGGIVVSVIRRR